MDKEYAIIISMVGISFYFSSTMPGLYPLVTLTLILHYWVQKWKLLRWKSRPEMFDHRMGVFSLYMLGITALSHVGGLWYQYYYSPTVNKAKEGFLTDFLGPRSSDDDSRRYL